MQSRAYSITLVLSVVLATTPLAAQQALHYRVGASRPASHLFDIDLDVPPADGCPDFAYAVWTPGGYTLHPHAEDVLDVTCTAPDGARLQVAKTDLNTWHVTCQAGGGYTAHIRLHALARKTPYSADVEPGLIFANTVAILPYLPAHQDLAATMTIEPPSNWKLVCSLPPDGQPNTFTAGSWDALADATFAASPGLTLRTFTRAKTAFTIALTRKPAPDLDLDAVVTAHAKLAAAAAKTFGGLPFSRYLFLYKVGPKGSHGGLEHSFSTAMGIPFSALANRQAFLNEMGLPAHEFVHAWNVKRARPRELEPYDYAHMQQTDLLWVAEGWTSYYGPLLLTRAGIRTPAQLYATFSRHLQAHRFNPENRFVSLRQMSLDSWLDPSVPFFTFRSYYVKGSLSGLDLDLLIRASSDGRNSLDTVMRALLNDPKLLQNGYTEADLRFLAGQAAGRPMDAWFARNIDRPGYLDVAPALASVGLRLVPDPSHPVSCFTGLKLAPTEQAHPGARIAWAEPDSPADDAGVGEGDILLAINGHTGDAAGLRRILDRLAPEEPAVLTVLRGDTVLRATMTPAQAQPLRRWVVIEEDPNATPRQIAARNAWLWLGTQ
ncbi:MAG: M61 family metallopeptidase [Acidobacteria bacterium]|nr:M61 family metallopeptidase [Acidobacteriota bacterium]